MKHLVLPIIILFCVLCLLIESFSESEAKSDNANQVRISVIGGEEGWCGNRVGQFAAYYSGKKIAVVYAVSQIRVFKGNTKLDDWYKALPFQISEKTGVIKGKKIDLVGEWSDQIPEIPKAEKEFHAYEIYLRSDRH